MTPCSPVNPTYPYVTVLLFVAARRVHRVPDQSKRQFLLESELVAGDDDIAKFQRHLFSPGQFLLGRWLDRGDAKGADQCKCGNQVAHGQSIVQKHQPGNGTQITISNKYAGEKLIITFQRKKVVFSSEFGNWRYDFFFI